MRKPDRGTPTAARKTLQQPDDDIPVLAKAPEGVGAQEMRRLEHWAGREFQISPLMMMEATARAAAELAWRRFKLDSDAHVLVLAGKGANGGAALSAGRYLAHKGHPVTALLSEPATKLREDAKRSLAAFRKEGGSAPQGKPGDALPEAALVIDGLIGYGLMEGAREGTGDLIRAANDSDVDVLSIDVPSGLNPDTGDAQDPAIRAAATMALALVKLGTLEKHARPYVGDLYVADIGFPRSLYDDFDTTPEDLFGRGILARVPI